MLAAWAQDIYRWNCSVPLTVACDVSPFAYPGREQFFLASGILQAKRIAKQWVRQHPCGQARVLEGHYKWVGNEYVKFK